MIPLPYKRQFSTATPPVELKYNFGCNLWLNGLQRASNWSMILAKAKMAWWGGMKVCA
jgi:hypothetical protein